MIFDHYRGGWQYTRNGKTWDRSLSPLLRDMQENGLAVQMVRGVRSRSKIPNSQLGIWLKKALEGRIQKFRTQLWSIANPYTLVLRRIRPSFVISRVAPPRLCEAAHSLKIPIVELLHARGYPAGYRRWVHRDVTELPSGFACFDRQSAFSFRALGPTRLFNKWGVLDKDFLQESLARNSFWVGEIKRNFEKVIAFTGTFDNEDLFWGMPESLKGSIFSNKDWLWLISCHPVALSDPKFFGTVQELKNLERNHPNVLFTWPSSVPIGVLFSVADVHVTWDSMASFEAAELGIPTLVLDPVHPNTRMSELYNYGYLQNVPSEQEALNSAIFTARNLGRFKQELGFNTIDGLVEFAHSCGSRAL